MVMFMHFQSDALCYMAYLLNSYYSTMDSNCFDMLYLHSNWNLKWAGILSYSGESEIIDDS